MLSIKLLESDNIITKKIHSAYAKMLDQHLSRASGKVVSALRPIISSAISSSPEMQSVSGGILKADFGLTLDPVPNIAAAVADTINLQYNKIRSDGRKFTGGFILTIQPNDYANVLGLSVATQAIQGGSLPWLSWLLTLGDAVIIANYTVEYGPYGRTGRAKMTETGRPFKVNSAFSGDANDNFITRAMQANKNTIINTIVRTLE
tara:strand:+ start:858 stop:1472 length:615 start_codon:yes stop_codon:yes gene_type:complete